MKCRIKKIVTAASAVALTFAATPSMKLYAASVDEAPKVVSTAGANNTVVKAAVNETWADKTVLEKDTTVDGDLILKADVDLNGYNLIVNGDLKNISGTITPNGGNLAVKGNYDLGNPSVTAAGDTVYSTCTGGLIVDGSDVTVYGDFITHNVSTYYGVKLTSGTLSIGGNININGGVKVDYDNGARIVLNGKGKQDIRFAGCPKLNELEIWDSEKRDVCWHGELNAMKLVSDATIKPVDLKICNLDTDGHSLVIDGSCTKADGNLSLNGGTFTVKGQFVHPTGIVIPGGGAMDIQGDYVLENVTADGKYNTCTGAVLMDNEKDVLMVSGLFKSYKVSTYYGIRQNTGVIYFSGDVDMNSGLNISYEYNARMVLSGEKTQEVHFVDCPQLNEVEIWNSEKRDVYWNGNLNAMKLVSDATIKPVDLKICNLDTDGHSLVIDGSCAKADGNLSLNGGTFTVKGQFVHPTGIVIPGGGAMDIQGDYVLENVTADGKYNTCTGAVLMDNEKDVLMVSGLFKSYKVSTYYGIRQNTGVIYFAGDVDMNSGLNISYEYNARMVLSGEKTQEVHFVDCPQLNEVEIWKSNERDVYWNGLMNIQKLVSGAYIKAVDFKLADLCLDQTLHIDGDVTMTSGVVDLNGSMLEINGSLKHPTGNIIPNGGTLFVCGDYELMSPAGEDKYNNCTGAILMDNETDLVVVEGLMTSRHVSTYYGIRMNTGSLYLGGDIDMNSGLAITQETDSKIVLNGIRSQKVHFVDCPKLNQLQIQNSEKRSVYWNGVLNAYKLLEDATVIPVDMVINDFDLDGHKFFIKGNVTKDTGNLRLGAGAVLETGRFDQKAGSVVLDGGMLSIQGDYTLAAPGSKEGTYNTCTGSVYMNNTDDIMFVEGSFVTHNVSTYYGAFFNCGTLQVLEDILVDTNCFRLGSTASRQYTVLNGKRAQTIKLPKGVKFDSLEINKPLSFYNFSEDNCWAELNNTFKAENPKVEYAKGKGCVKLTWGEAFCADKYGITMYVDGKWKMIDQGPGTSYVLNNLKPGVNYKVAVVARFGGEWNMDVSNAIVVTPQTENRYPVVKYQVSGSQFRLKWTPADGAQKYGLAVYQSGKWVAKVQFDANTTTYTSPKMKKGSYTMAVCAKVNGKWDVDHIKQRSFTVTIK